LKALVVKWLKAGADPREGIRLFAEINGKNHPFLKLARKCTPATHAILVNTLCAKFNIERHSEPNVILREARPNESPSTLEVKKPTAIPFRQQFPFLSNPDCPQQLKVLAADKLTCYYKYKALHLQLFDVTDPDELLEVTKGLVETFIENRAIYKEFEYYGKHNFLLGKHPIFNEYNELQQLAKLGIVDLCSKRKKLEHNIWRITDQLGNKKEKHLIPTRAKRLQSKQRQLNEVNRLINNFKS